MKKIISIIVVFLLFFTTYSMGKTTEKENSNKFDKLSMIRDRVDFSLSITSDKKFDNKLYEKRCLFYKDTMKNYADFSSDLYFIHSSDFEDIWDVYNYWHDNELVKIKSKTINTNNWHSSKSRPVYSDRKMIYVDDDSECPGDGTINWPFCKIQYAIDNASSGDNIFVFSGTYYENIVIDKSVTIEGEDWLTTVIDGNKKRDVVYVIAG